VRERSKYFPAPLLTRSRYDYIINSSSLVWLLVISIKGMIVGMSEDKKLTTATGCPIFDNQNSITAGPRGPLLMQDVQLLEQMQQFNRERIPERVVHAKGSGAYGTFTVTRAIPEYTKAKFLSEVGKQTEIFLRFSTVAGERGAADAERDVRGFAVKFYTEEGVVLQKLFKDRAIFTISSRSRSNSKNLIHEFYLT